MMNAELKAKFVVRGFHVRVRLGLVISVWIVRFRVL
jgi:hypothetical protein